MSITTPLLTSQRVRIDVLRTMRVPLFFCDNMKMMQYLNRFKVRLCHPSAAHLSRFLEGYYILGSFFLALHVSNFMDLMLLIMDEVSA